MKNRNRSGWIAIAFIAVIALVGVFLIGQRSAGTAAQAAGSKDVVEKHIQHETPTPATPIPVDLSKNSETRYVRRVHLQPEARVRVLPRRKAPEPVQAQGAGVLAARRGLHFRLDDPQGRGRRLLPPHQNGGRRANQRRRARKSGMQDEVRARRGDYARQPV